jgi:hypothetical protein
MSIHNSYHEQKYPKNWAASRIFEKTAQSKQSASMRKFAQSDHPVEDAAIAGHARANAIKLDTRPLLSFRNFNNALAQVAFLVGCDSLSRGARLWINFEFHAMNLGVRADLKSKHQIYV